MDARLELFAEAWRRYVRAARSAVERDRLGAVAAFVGLLMMSFRFYGFDLVPFINDEAYFLGASRQEVLTGKWLLASPIAGTQGLHYGPSVLWFYGIVQTIFGFMPRTSIAVMCLVVTSAHVALAAALARAFRGGLLLFGVLVALIASSPCQYFWSRLAWDPLVNALSAWAVVGLAVDRPSWKRAAVVGVVLGAALSSHLMVTPFVLAFGFLWLIEQWREPRRLVVHALALAIPALVVNTPYLIYLLHERPSMAAAPTVITHPLTAYALQPVRAAGLWDISYFFDQEWGAFQAWNGLEASFLFDAAAAPLPLGLVAGAGLVVASFKGSTDAARRVARLGVLVWAGYSAFFYLRQLEPHPHYQFPTWWVVPAGVAGTFASLRADARRWLSASIAVLALVQFAFVVRWESYVRAHEGTRGIHYATPVLAEQRALARACAETGESGALDVINETSLFPVALQYVADVLPACRGHVVRVCNGTCGPRPSGLVRHLRYANPEGGAIRVE